MSVAGSRGSPRRMPSCSHALKASGSTKVTISQVVSNRIIYLHLDHFRDDSPFVRAKDGAPIKNPLRDRRVRQALNYALDKSHSVKLLAGAAIPAHGLLIPGVPGRDDALAPYPHDPAKARALLGYEPQVRIGQGLPELPGPAVGLPRLVGLAHVAVQHAEVVPDRGQAGLVERLPGVIAGQALEDSAGLGVALLGVGQPARLPPEHADVDPQPHQVRPVARQVGVGIDEALLDGAGLLVAPQGVRLAT